MYQGKVTIVNERLMGRFDSNKYYYTKSSKVRWWTILKTKLYAMWLDYLVIDDGHGIYFSVRKKEDR